jgi:hypothetical protein
VKVSSSIGCENIGDECEGLPTGRVRAIHPHPIAFRLTSHVHMCEQHPLQSAPWANSLAITSRRDGPAGRIGCANSTSGKALGRELFAPRDALNNSAISDGFGKRGI